MDFVLRRLSADAPRGIGERGVLRAGAEAALGAYLLELGGRLADAEPPLLLRAWETFDDLRGATQRASGHHSTAPGAAVSSVGPPRGRCPVRLRVTLTSGPS